MLLVFGNPLNVDDGRHCWQLCTMLMLGASACCLGGVLWFHSMYA